MNNNIQVPSAIDPTVNQFSSGRPVKSSSNAFSSSALFAPSAAPATPAPTPILKVRIMEGTANSTAQSNPRKRNFKPSFSVEFSEEAMATIGTKDKHHDLDESDTDVGSSANGDASYTFDCEDDMSAVNPYEKTPETTNSSYSLSRVGAKVRRLDLSGGGDVKQSSAGGVGSVAVHPLAESPVRFRSPPASPKRGSRGRKTKSLGCPPSTAKKGPLSRLLLNNVFESIEDDDSPRDASEFPFFVDSPPKQKYVTVAKEKVKLDDSKSNYFLSADNEANYDTGSFSYAPVSPKCPPTTMKKMNRRRDLSPPKSLRTHGRANSFLQMFSQEPLVNVDDEDMHPTSPRCPPTAMKKTNRRRELTPPKSLRAHGRADSFLQMFSQEPLVNADDDDMKSDDSADAYTLKSPNDIREERSSPVDSSIESQHSSFSRFVADFEVVGTLGNGSFGCVYKVRNRMDRRMYAIKAAKREARGLSDRDRMLQEVFALAALSDDTTAAAMHIVRYHQAWMEGNRLYIQTELCDGNLEKEMAQGVMDEKRRYKVLREMLLALDLVHKSGMIHLDIKPENIFIKNDQYKLGDFGLVSKIENHNDVEEGDSRYMSMELLSGDLDDLTKSDIFSLGATMYEICLGRPLPENGPEWQDIRHGTLLPMPNTAFELQMIVRIMMAPEKESRPSAADLLKKRQLMSIEQQQLIVERNKANAANMALNQMQRIQSSSPRKRFHRSNTGHKKLCKAIAADQAQAESHTIHKREFDRIRVKYGLDNAEKAGQIAELLANTDANEGVSAPEFAKMFGMSTEEAVVFLEWIKVGIKFKEETLDTAKKAGFSNPESNYK
eukprot:CCRYP_003505-RA/>CCRYP_003505-RA protein AED:0.26 eAED:0.26 QI:135/0.8/0.66/1/1/1/6/451/832